MFQCDTHNMDRSSDPDQDVPTVCQNILHAAKFQAFKP